MELNLKDSLRMNTGDGENSYLQCSKYVQKIVASTLPKFEKSVQSLYNHDLFPCENLNVADLGCSTGPNTFLVMSTVLKTISDKSKELNLQIPEIQFQLNDLPSNDFNTLFKGVRKFQEKHDAAAVESPPSFFCAGVAGSFHDRLFLRNSLHLVHCSYAAHWLSKLPKFVSNQGVPLNKGNVYISKTTPISVKKAYFSLFEKDFTCFLKSRSEEMVTNGLMFLILQGREFEDPTSCKSSFYSFDALSKALAALVSQGVVDEEKLDDFNMPLYAVSRGEVGGVVKKEGSFAIEQLETMIMETGDIWSSVQDMVKSMRVFTEPLLAIQFGGGDVMDKVYDKVLEIVEPDWKQMSQLKRAISVLVVLRKV